jgi:2-keto-4-pentenoate hydratase
VSALASELVSAFGERRLVPAPSTVDAAFDLTAAYAVEAEIAAARRAAGRKTVGWKVGYANKAMWRALKMETLVWAHMYDDTVRYADWNDATTSIASMIAPKIEPEIVFQLKAVPKSSEAADVIDAIDWMALGFEIIDCPFPDWKFQPADFVAARGLHAALIVGEPVFIEPDMLPALIADMETFTVRVLKDGQLVEEGAGKNALKSPLLCVGELASAMVKRGGETLQAGDIISTGTLTASIPMAPGETWIASLSGISPSALTLHIK